MSNEIIKCNCCGGTEIEIKPHSRIGRCKSCGASVILPDLEDHEILALLDEAYIERSNFEFDKAASIYEYILTKNPNEICAFEGLILCKYGIIYVKDPQTGDSIPTCHRYSPISIFDDQDFVNYFTICPTEEEKNVFRKMGDDIEHLQKEISKQLAMLGHQFEMFGREWDSLSTQLERASKAKEKLDSRVTKINSKFGSIAGSEIQEIEGEETPELLPEDIE